MDGAGASIQALPNEVLIRVVAELAEGGHFGSIAALAQATRRLSTIVNPQLYTPVSRVQLVAAEALIWAAEDDETRVVVALLLLGVSPDTYFYSSIPEIGR
ncbi:hypothetical protein B0H63DRAFT_445571 [Podospora didyma]|uniref:Uncharacterized protein n=1 Tax=Podospora didyma TaxID=330526 RepID=A0AAE0NXB7_9PEZI|nr:hypothetical protein B0H63DRAFT_445571 [Podospora didyma]